MQNNIVLGCLRRILAVLLCTALVVGSSGVSVLAQEIDQLEVQEEQLVGDGETWELSEGVLTISGSGGMTDYSEESPAPWSEFANTITSVVIGDGITSIGQRAFAGITSLESVTIPQSLSEIKEEAFLKCYNLKSITVSGDEEGATGVIIPGSVTAIGADAFKSCTSVTNVYFFGTDYSNYLFDDTTICDDFSGIWGTRLHVPVTVSVDILTAETAPALYAWHHENANAAPIKADIPVEGYYAITFINLIQQNGEVISDKSVAQEGDTVTVTMTPNEGYVPIIVATNTVSNTAVETTETEPNVFTFTMPAAEVSVYATFDTAQPVTVDGSIEHGTVTVSKESAVAGEVVDVNVAADTGYVLASLTYKTTYNTTEEITPDNEGNYSFEVPWGGAVVNATFQKGGTADEGYHNITVTTNNAWAGTISSDYASAQEETIVTLTVTMTSQDNMGIPLVTDADGTEIEVTEAADGSYTFTMPATDVTVDLNLIAYAYVYAGTITNGTVTIAKANELPGTKALPGETITVTAVPAEGYVLDSLTYTQIYNSTATAIEADTEGNYTFDIPSWGGSYVVTATFVALSDIHTITVVEAENGQVSADKESALEGATVNVTVTPAAGYKVGSVKYNDTVIEAVNNSYSFVMPDEHVEIVATFEEDPTTGFHITVSSAEHGTVTPSTGYSIANETITLAVVPDSGYVLSLLEYTPYVGSDYYVALEANESGEYSFTMPYNNVYIRATFLQGGSEDEGYHKVNVVNTTTYAGTIAADHVSAKDGDKVIVTASPAEEYALGTVTVKDSAEAEVTVTAEEDGTYSFIMPDSEVTVSATFGKPYSITIADTEGGTITADKQTSIPGDIVTVTVTPDEEYLFGSLSVSTNPTITGGNGVYSFAMPYNDVTISATWTENKPEFRTHSLEINGEIGVRFYMNLPKNGIDYSTSYMMFKVGNSKTSVKAAFNRKLMNKSKTYYGFICTVNSIQMAETITAVYHYFTSSGAEKTITNTYSVVEYVESFINSAQSNAALSEMLDFVLALADYGHYAQLYLSDVNGWTLGKDYAASAAYGHTQSFSDAELNAIMAALADKEISRVPSADIQKITYNLKLESLTELKVFFKPVTGYSGTVSATIDGKKAKVTKSSGRYVVTLTGLKGNELDVMHTINLTTTSGTSVVELCPMSYVYSCLQSRSTVHMTDAVAALYNYGVEYKAFVG